MIFIEIQDPEGTCLSFMEQFSDLDLEKKSHALKDVLLFLSLELGDRVWEQGTCLQVFLLFQLSEQFMSPFFIDDAETDLPARAER